MVDPQAEASMENRRYVRALAAAAMGGGGPTATATATSSGGLAALAPQVGRSAIIARGTEAGLEQQQQQQQKR